MATKKAQPAKKAAAKKAAAPAKKAPAKKAPAKKSDEVEKIFTKDFINFTQLLVDKHKRVLTTEEIARVKNIVNNK
jgi:hypothetical protein